MRWLIVWKFVSRPPSQRWLTYGMPARLGDLLDRVAGLLLGARRTGRCRRGAAMLAGELLGLLEQACVLQQVDDVDAAALAEDEAAHLGVPAARLVAEVDAGLQQLPDADLGHCGAPLCRVGLLPAGGPRTRLDAPGRAAALVPAGPRIDGRSEVSALGQRASVRSRPYARAPPLVRRRRRGSDLLPLRPVRAVRARAAGAARDGPLPTHVSGPRPPPRARARRRGRRQRRLDLGRRPSPGAAKARRAACRNWRSSPSSPARAVLGVAGDGVADRPADATRIWCVRPVSRRTRSSVVAGQRALDLEVGDGRRAACRCRSTSRVRTRRSRPIGASIVPAARRRAALDEREVLALASRGARSAACSARWAASCARPRAGPRCRGPGGGRCRRAPGPRRRPPGPPAPGRACPSRWPARGVHDHARPACRHQQVRRPRRRRGTARARRRRARAPSASAPTVDALAAAQDVALGHAARRPRARGPPSISALGLRARAERRRPGRRRAARRRPQAGPRAPSTLRRRRRLAAARARRAAPAPRT